MSAIVDEYKRKNPQWTDSSRMNRIEEAMAQYVECC